MTMNAFVGFEPTDCFFPTLRRIQSALCFYVVLQYLRILTHSMYKQATENKQAEAWMYNVYYFCVLLFLCLLYFSICL